MERTSNSQQLTTIIIAVVITLLCSCFSGLSGLAFGYALNDALSDLNQLADRQTNSSVDAVSGQQGRLLFEDDFSDRRWDTYEDSEHLKGYDDNRYVIEVDIDGYDFWSTAGRHFENFALEVETAQLAGPDDNNYGVIFRHQDDSNFYRFEISGDGFYTFGKVVKDEFRDIIAWQESDLINQSNQRNTIRIEAVGSTFTFYINGQAVDSAVDTEFRQGDIGFLVGTYDEIGARIAFDDLKVWAME